jgi:hypothetical protein
MQYLTAEQIAERAEKYDGRANRAAINKLYRKQDESHLYPISDRFNATERAIRRLQRYDRAGACINDGLEYAMALEAELSHIVNAEV